MKRCPQCTSEFPDTTTFCPHDGKSLEVTDPMIGRMIGGRYRMIARVGRGGMGAVYRAEHVKMRRVTAIKILAPTLAANADFVARFQREAELASTISHPHAVAIYDFGEEDGLVYLAMEFLDGESLATKIARDRRLPVALAVRVARQAAEALDAAHRRGIIHRDFKPDNVMLCGPAGELPTVKVVDFGIAKQTDASAGGFNLTQTGSVLGTPTYMSPEQAADRPLDPRSDLYSLALTIYQMLAGALPFRGDSPQSMMVQRLLEAPTPLRAHAPEVPPAIEAVIMKALAKEPFQRQATVLQFAAELEHAATSTQASPAVGPAIPISPNPTVPYQTPPYQTPASFPPTTGSANAPVTSPTHGVPPAYPTPTPTPYGVQPTSYPSPTHGVTPVFPVSAAHGVPPVTMTDQRPARRGSGALIAMLIAVAFLVVVVPIAGYGIYRAYFAEPTPGGPGPTKPMGTTPNAESIPYLAQLSRDLREQENYEEAEQKARDAVAIDGKSATALAALADALLDQSKNSEAGPIAQQAVDADRKNPTAHRVLAMYFLSDRQIQKAIDESTTALGLNPSPEDAALAHITLGAAYVEKDLYDQALEEFNKAKGFRDRSTVPILARMGIADALAGKKNIDAGIRDLVEIANDPATRPNARAAVNMRIAKLNLFQGKPSEAVAYCDKALQTGTVRGVRAAAHVIQGMGYLQQKKSSDAIAAAEAALKEGGDDRQIEGYAYAIKGVGLVQQGRKDDGVWALTRARQILPNDPGIGQLASLAGVQG